MKNKIGFSIRENSRKLEKFFRRKLKLRNRIVIELTNRCNLNCPYCLVGMQEEQKSVAHSDLKRSLGMMEMSLAEKVIKDAKELGISEVMLTFQGEPLLHKSFVDFIKLSKKKEYDLKTIVFTNGLLLNPVLSREIVRAGLYSIRFSIDGASEETYQLNRVGGQFGKAFQNMEDMARIKKEEESELRIEWQFLILANNEHEIDDEGKKLVNEKLVNKINKIGVKFFPKRFAESIPELAPRNPKCRRALKQKPCTDIYEMLCVYWNGDVVPCCYDVSGKEIMGNVNNNTIKEIWNSPQYVQFRKRVKQAVRYPKQEPQLCKTCLRWASLDKINSNQEVKV